MHIERARLEAFLAHLERMAGGDSGIDLPLSPHHDELDAIAHGVNVLADELRWTHERIARGERRRAADLVDAKERAEQSSEEKSVFLRTASHEIRTPIAAILGIADQLADSSLSDVDRALVDRLRENGRALLSLVGNVLDLSRLDADKISLTVEPVAPVELIRDVVRSVEGDVRGKGLSVSVTSEVPPSLTIQADRVRLRQILVNMIANAVKFTSRGGLDVTVRTERCDDTGRLTIDVTDSGIGIDAGQQQYLFEPFGQADASIVRVHGGTGLGLALSSRLAERLGGSLTLHWSQPGRGSTFRLTLDASAAVTGARITPPPAIVSPPSATEPLDGIRVLLADDHPDLRQAIGRSLEVLGASIAYAHDGREAVRKAKTGGFDVVVMDLLMPLLTGLEATRALRADGCAIPVIAISADAAPEMHAAATAAGCNALVSKPFDPSELTEAIRVVVQGALGASGD